MCGFIGAATTQIYTYCHPLSLHDALPIFLPANTWLNGNTASAPVLAAYVPGLSLPRAQALIAERDGGHWFRSEENTSELQSLMRISYAVFCLKKKTELMHIATK